MANKSQADRMLKLALDSDILLFIDQYGAPYIRYPQGPREIPVTYSLKSGIVKDWLASLLWASEKKAPNSQSTSSTLSVLRALAREGPIITLYNRVSPYGDETILIDLGNAGWNYVRVTPQGWNIGSLGISRFRRYNHQKEMPTPKPNGNPKDLLRFTNLVDDTHRLLFLVTVISYFIPEIQHPILIFYGPHGSGKSLSMRAARQLIDPSIVELLTLPRSDRELVQQLYHHYGAFYDNLHTIPQWASDIFCRAVTGAGNTKRQLYTDDDDIIYEYRRCIGLNGINIAAQKSDLLDRSILLRCEMMESSRRIEEKKLSLEMRKSMPSIFGGALNTIVKALNIYPSIELSHLHRMADFTRWGCAITEALGYNMQVFLDAYSENINAQSEETLKASILAHVLINWMSHSSIEDWSGSPSKLYDLLCDYAEANNISIRQKAWPKTSHWMARRLNEVAPSLYHAGYIFESNRTSRKRVITIRKTSGNTVSGVTTVISDNNDNKNNKLGLFS